MPRSDRSGFVSPTDTVRAVSFRRRPAVALRHHMRLDAPEHRARLESVGVCPKESVMTAWRCSDEAVSVTMHGPARVETVRVTGFAPRVAAIQALPTAGFVVVSHDRGSVRA